MDAVTPSKSESRKRKGRSEDDDSRVEINRSGIDGGDESDRDLSLEDSLVFNDTMIALRMMRAQFPKFEKDARPVIPKDWRESQTSGAGETKTRRL